MVKAPISGVVSDRPVQVGEFISERTVVATIVQMNPLKLRTGVQERHAGVVKPGQPVEFRVESFGDRVFKGAVALHQPVSRPDDAHVHDGGARRQRGTPA